MYAAGACDTLCWSSIKSLPTLTATCNHSTLIIGLHTFLTVFFHFKPPRWAWIAVITVQWSFLGLYIVIAYFKTKGPVPYYAPTP